MSSHKFNTQIATLYGVNEAIILENLSFWQLKNEANENNFYDEKYWVYNSIKAFERLFPYWSKGQINRILKHLEDEEVIHVGNYNRSSYDRTKWYSVNQKIHLLISGNGFNEIKKPIPDSKPDSKPNETIQSEFETFWEAYPKKVMKGNAEKKFYKVIQTTTLDVLLKGLKTSEQVLRADKQYIPNAQSWLNSKGWEDEDSSVPIIKSNSSKALRAIALAGEDRGDDY